MPSQQHHPRHVHDLFSRSPRRRQRHQRNPRLANHQRDPGKPNRGVEHASVGPNQRTNVGECIGRSCQRLPGNLGDSGRCRGRPGIGRSVEPHGVLRHRGFAGSLVRSACIRCGRPCLDGNHRARTSTFHTRPPTPHAAGARLRAGRGSACGRCLAGVLAQPRQRDQHHVVHGDVNQRCVLRNHVAARRRLHPRHRTHGSSNPARFPAPAAVLRRAGRRTHLVPPCRTRRRRTVGPVGQQRRGTPGGDRR